jgi:predicted nucleic acid-binding protein
MCTMAALEVLNSARNAPEHRATFTQLTRFPWFELSDPRVALELQYALALRGWHRASLPDVVIACIAAEHGLTVLHYDSDYERLAEVAGIQHEWVVERGTGHP